MNIKGFAVAALHLALVASLAAKYTADRERLPRVWAKTAPYDPNLPIRGRYVRLQVRVEDAPEGVQWKPVRLIATADGRLSALANPEGDPAISLTARVNGESVLTQPVAFFIPEHIDDPSRRPEGEELWVEVTVPKQGPPRPIRLGVKKDGVLKPLDIR